MTLKLRCSYAHAHCSWLMQDGNRQKTNTLRSSLESSSKFSTSLSCTFLLQREAPLMAPFHTWIRRAHYSTGGGGAQTCFQQRTPKCPLSKKKTVHKEMPLIRLIIVSCYTFSPFSAVQIRSTRAHQHEKQMLKYCARAHARARTKPSAQKKTAAPANEDWISLVTSAVQIFPSVSIATATSHSLTEQSMTHRLVTNKNCNETLTESRLDVRLIPIFSTNECKQTD